jgi:hypothetical protein
MLYALAYAATRALLGLLVRGGRLSAADVELLALRHEARTRRRAGGRRAWRPADRLLLAALSRCLPVRDWGVFPVHAATLRRWHRELLRPRRCADGPRRGPGRPPLTADVQALIARLARENVGWGYRRIRGELLRLGHDVSATAIRTTLRRGGIPPAPRRSGLAWPVFLRAQAAGVLASAPAVADAFRARVLGRRLGNGVAARRASSAGPAAACRRPATRARLGTPFALGPRLLAWPAPSRPGAALDRRGAGPPPVGRRQPMHGRDRGVLGPARRPRYPPPRAAPAGAWVWRPYSAAEAARHRAA